MASGQWCPASVDKGKRVKTVALNRALSKLGVMSRAQATDAIRGGRVTVNGRSVRDPLTAVVPERARIAVDGTPASRTAWRTILFHKPRGVVTSRRDPDGRRTIYDVLGGDAAGLVPVGRLDLATSGLLILTNDTQLAHRLTAPERAISRVYVVTVRGQVTPDEIERLGRGVVSRGDDLRPLSLVLRKASRRESHLTVELQEGRNREVRRIFDAIGHEVTRLKRVRFGLLELGNLQPGEWREVVRAEFGGWAGGAG